MASSERAPSRLLYLGRDALKPRLWLIQESDMYPRYATLSHCWGDSQPLKLTKSTFTAMIEGIDIEQLSKTYRDAMETTRRLGLDYIWIDSLCIIQDDNVDWTAESMIMGDIYQNAVINIAATDAASGQEGCYRERSLAEVSPCMIQATRAYGATRTIFLLSRHAWDRTIDNSPLLTRAWVIQELILSKRTLHFARGQMFWDCCERRANETYPHGMPSDLGRKISINFASQEAGDPVDTSPYDKYVLWNEIVEKYTQANLTFQQKDKLVAISSLAGKMGLNHHILVAGLWKDCISQQLLWWCLPGAPVRPSYYQAPSWSWASTIGGVSFSVEHNIFDPSQEAFGKVLLPGERNLIDVVGFDLRHRDENPRSQLIGGSMKLWAPIVKFQNLEDLETYNDGSYPLKSYHAYKIIADGCVIPKGWLYCLLVMALRIHRGVKYFGIVIRSTGETQGQFCRIGYVTIQRNGPGYNEGPISRAEWRESFTSLLLGKGSDDAEEVEGIDTSHADGLPRCLVTLV